MDKIKILAIETSCDETAAAVLFGDKIKSSIVYSQLNLHRKTDGIVPEVASRAHIEKIITVVEQALLDARTRPKEIDLVAVTIGPGLIGSLLVGVDTAKALGFIWGKPMVPINHVEGHIYANFVREIKNKKSKIKNIFPAIALIASGGHTSLILMRGHGNYKLLGSTLDDAAGECFDKVAKILNLGYPGGPAIAAAAVKSKILNPKSKISFPRPMIDSGNFDFSFSGLKTAVLYAVRNLEKYYQVTRLPDYIITAIAAEFQQVVADVLISKTIKAARVYKAKLIMLGGGVAANKLLRRHLRAAVKKELPNSLFLIPNSRLCTDNAAMIGLCAYYRYLKDKKNLKNWREIKINLNPKL